MILKNFMRVNGSSRLPCYTQSDMSKYESDHFHRAGMIGSMIGIALYYLCTIYLILPETRNDFEVVKQWQLSQIYLPTFCGSLLIIYIIKYFILSCLNAYIVFVMQVAILLFTIVGTYQFRCLKDTAPDPITSGGVLPMFFINVVKSIFGSSKDRLREQLYQARCDPALTRMLTVQAIGELINLIYAIVLLSCQP